MVNLKINLEKMVDDSYTITLGSGIINGSIHEIMEGLKPSSAVFISDSNVSSIYSDLFRNFKTGFRSLVLSFRAGEKSKNIRTIMKLFSGLVKNRIDRKSLIIAIGGGVTGDLAGFLASIYLRGVPFIQIPTSLLAMVDSSIGGKTGIDTLEGKNLIGRFYQPKAVIIDTDFLSTLPPHELVNGMSEVIKHSLIRDASYFRFILENRDRILSLEGDTLLELIGKSCRIKASVVEEDEREISLRQILNFGHTAGHALERASAYSIPHGYAVALGMIIESHISCERKLLAQSELEQITVLIKSYGLAKCAGLIKGISSRTIYGCAVTDKKNENGIVRAVMLGGIGNVYSKGHAYSFPVSENEIKTGLEYLFEQVRA